MQIQGSGTGDYASTAIVDASVDTQHGRLWVNTFPIDSYRLLIGNLFQAGSYTQNMVVDGSGLIFLCPGSVDIHLIFESNTDADAQFEFFENVHVSNSGTSIPIYNRSRHAASLGSTINASLWSNPIVNSSGGILYSAFFLGGSGPANRLASNTVNLAPGNADWLLEAGSCYMVQIKNEAGRLLNLDYNIVLHEHEHGT